MKLLNKLFGAPAPAKTYIPQSEQEAWIAIMYASMHIDGYIADAEIRKMFSVVGRLPLFKGKNIADYYQPALLANRKVGSYNLIDGSVPLIKEDEKILFFHLRPLHEDARSPFSSPPSTSTT